MFLSGWPTASKGRARPASRPCRHHAALQTEAETTTEKFGLEAGLWKVWTHKGDDGQSKGQQVRAVRHLGGPLGCVVQVCLFGAGLGGGSLRGEGRAASLMPAPPPLALAACTQLPAQPRNSPKAGAAHGQAAVCVPPPPR